MSVLRSALVLALVVIGLCRASPFKRNELTIENGAPKFCGFCPQKCIEHYGGEEGAQEHINKVVKRMNKILRENDIDMQFEVEFVYLTEVGFTLVSYSGDVYGDEGLGLSNSGFWEHNALFTQFQDYKHCALGMLFQDEDDVLWESTSGRGVATWFTMCSDTAYSIIFDYSKVATAATIGIHELFHLFGAKHDNQPVPASIKALASDDRYAAYVNETIAQCDGVKGNCEDEKCIMNSAPIGGATYPTKISPCTKAYMKLWLNYESNAYDPECVGAVQSDESRRGETFGLGEGMTKKHTVRDDAPGFDITENRDDRSLAEDDASEVLLASPEGGITEKKRTQPDNAPDFILPGEDPENLPSSANDDAADLPGGGVVEVTF